MRRTASLDLEQRRRHLVAVAAAVGCICGGGHGTLRCYPWLCTGCGALRPLCLGAADDLPRLCDPCWGAVHSVSAEARVELWRRGHSEAGGQQRLLAVTAPRHEHLLHLILVSFEAMPSGRHEAA